MTDSAADQAVDQGVARPGRNVALARFLARYGLPIVVVLMVVSFGVLQPRVFALQNLVNVARSASDLALLATAEAFVLLFGHVDISVGSTVGASSVVTAWAVTRFGMPGIVAGVLLGGLVGLVNGFIVAKFRIHSVIVTIGTLTALRGWTFWVTNGQPVFGGLPDSFLVLGAGYLGPIPIPVVVAGLVMLGASFTLRYTKYGPAMYAIGGNEEAAHLAGIRVFRYQVLVFVIAGALAGLAGTVLASRIFSGQPNLGVGMELDAIAAAVIGGMALTGGRGTIGGVALGVAILAVLRNGLNLTNVDSFVQQMLTGLVILGAVIADRLRHSSGRTDA